jgi:hypothetical protein
MKLNGGFYKNRSVAGDAAHYLSENMKIPDDIDYVQTTFVNNFIKREIKIRSSVGVIRTLRYK